LLNVLRMREFNGANSRILPPGQVQRCVLSGNFIKYAFIKLLVIAEINISEIPYYIYPRMSKLYFRSVAENVSAVQNFLRI